MTEFWFAGDAASAGIATPGGIVTAWSDQFEGMRHTELADADGNIVDHVVVADAASGYPDGTIPRFKGPRLTIWVSVDDGPRMLMVSTDLPDLLRSVREAAVEAQNAARESASKARELAQSSSVAAHEGAPDPHPQYHNDERGDARYLRSRPDAMPPLTEPRELVDITSMPDVDDANMREVWVTNNGVRRLVSWLNERGLYRGEQVPGALWDSPFTSVVNYRGTGAAYLVQQRLSNGVRKDVGGFDVLGRPITSKQPWVDIVTIDPNAIGRYTKDAAAGLAPLQVRWDSDDVMRLQGRIAVGTGGTVSGHVVMVLPDDYRPTTARLLGVCTSTGIACPCEVMPTGEVIVRRTQTGTFSLSFDDLTVSN